MMNSIVADRVHPERPMPVLLSESQEETRPMRVLIRVADGEYRVEIANSVDEAWSLCRQLGSRWWKQIGWQESI